MTLLSTRIVDLLAVGVRALRVATSVLAMLGAVFVGLGTASGAVELSHARTAYDVPSYAYDVATHTAQAHTGEVAFVASNDVSEGLQGTVAAAARPLPVSLRLSVAADTVPPIAANSAGWADFIASADGIVVPTSRSQMVAGFEEAGLPSVATRAPGTQYTLPNGSLVRVMEPSGQAPLRASFTDSLGHPINPFTGKVPQPPPGVSGAAWRQMMRDLTHVELGP